MPTLEAWEGRSWTSKYGQWILIPWPLALAIYAGVLLLCHWLGGWRLVGLFSIGLTLGLCVFWFRDSRTNYEEGLEQGLTEGMKFAHGRSWEEIEEEAGRIYDASFGKREWQTQKYFLVAVENIKKEMKR